MRFLSPSNRMIRSDELFYISSHQGRGTGVSETAAQIDQSVFHKLSGKRTVWAWHVIMTLMIMRPSDAGPHSLAAMLVSLAQLAFRSSDFFTVINSD